MPDTPANLDNDHAHAKDSGEASGGGHGPKYLGHHFESARQQFATCKLGMWVFLSTEILMFGGLFCAYAVYRSNHSDIFMYAHKMLDWKLGTINTVILLTSSMTMAWGVRAAQLGQQKILVMLLALTLLGGFGFLSVKYVEYTSKFHSGLYPGAHNAYFDVDQANKFLGLTGTDKAITQTQRSWHIKNIENHYFGAYGIHWEIPEKFKTPELGYHKPHHDPHASKMHDAKPVAHHEEKVSIDDTMAVTNTEATSGLSGGGGPEKTTFVTPGNGPKGMNPSLLTTPQAESTDAHAGHHIITYDQLPAMAQTRVHHFFQIYYLMTGLHVLHVLIGMSLIAWILVRAKKGHFSKEYNVPVDIVGLYWHLVDLIWIFLFPLLYLIH